MARFNRIPRHAAQFGRFFLCLILSFCMIGLFSGIAGAASRKKNADAPVKKPRKSSKSAKDSQAVPQGDISDAYYANTWREFEMGSAKEKKQSIAALKKLLKKDPSDAMAHYYLGIMLSQEGPAKQAEEHFRAALLAFPESDDVMYRLSEVLLERRKVDEAFQLLEKVHQINPKHAGALSKLGFKALVDGKVDQAIDFLTQARAEAPEDRNSLRELGIALFTNNRLPEALEVLQACLRLDDSDADAHLILGKVFQAMNKSAEAAAELGKAQSLGRKDVEIKALIGYDLGTSLADSGKTDEAIVELKKAIKTSEDPASGWFELGKIYEDRGDHEKAIKAYEKAYELSSKMGEAIFRIGKIYRSDEELDKGIEALRGILKDKEWGEQAKVEIDEMSQEKIDNKHDELMEIASSGDEDQKEKALQELLAINSKDQEALEELRDLAQSKGDLNQVEYYIKELKKAGFITKDQASIQLNELSYREDAGEDLAKWENRIEEFKKNGEWSKAIAENKKLKAYANAQLDYWKRYGGGKDKRAEMLKATKARIRTINETMKDLNAQKKQHK